MKKFFQRTETNKDAYHNFKENFKKLKQILFIIALRLSHILGTILTKMPLYTKCKKKM